MRTIRNILCSLFIFSLINSTVNGQSLTGQYRTAVGLRAGETSGIAFSHNLGQASGFELIAGIWSDWLSLTGLYERKVPAFNVDGMRWYYGAGGHGAVATGTYFREGRSYYRGDDFALGVDGVVGLEYKIPPIPFVVSFDAKPFMEIYRSGNLFFAIDPAISIKFTF